MLCSNHVHGLARPRHHSGGGGSHGFFRQVHPDAGGNGHDVFVGSAGTRCGDQHARTIREHGSARGRFEDGLEKGNLGVPCIDQGPVFLQGQMGSALGDRLKLNVSVGASMQPLAACPRLKDGLLNRTGRELPFIKILPAYQLQPFAA